VLDVYQEAHNKGFRPDMPLTILNIGLATTNSPNSSKPIRDDIRESIGTE
jgi:hypothetical protein